MTHGPLISTGALNYPAKAFALQPRNRRPPRRVVPISWEEAPKPGDCARAQGRITSARAQQLGNLHKLGCCWSAGEQGVLPPGSAGPTTPPTFEPVGMTRCALQTGE